MLVRRLAARFDVSRQATGIRLRTLGLVADPIGQALGLSSEGPSDGTPLPCESRRATGNGASALARHPSGRVEGSILGLTGSCLEPSDPERSGSALKALVNVLEGSALHDFGLSSYGHVGLEKLVDHETGKGVRCGLQARGRLF